jgi:hypothetical protein
LLIIACGALAKEITALVRANGWQHVSVQCLPASLHNTPAQIPAAVRSKLASAYDYFDRVFVAYGDCGTGSALDRVLAEYGAERIEGAHCYEFFAGSAVFQTLAEAEPGTFYLTDFLARHFERLVWQGLGLDRHPELLPWYFGHYRKLIYLAQTEQPALLQQAQAAAARLGLEFECRLTGYGGLQQALARVVEVARER